MRIKTLLVILGTLLFSIAALAKIPVYRDYHQVEKDLKKISTAYPSITTLETYGTTAESRLLYVLKISSGGKKIKPRVLITAAIHGDELITTELLFIFTNELLQGYGKIERFTKMIQGRDIYIIPVLSPDSFEARDRNVNGIDPNRAFPIPGRTNPEAVDVINSFVRFADKEKFTASLDLHAFGKMIMYPWSYTKSSLPTSDLATFQELAGLMVKTNGYKTGPVSELIHEAEGSSGDYLYWRHGTVAMAAEIGKEKIPHWNKFSELATESREMIWTFIEYF